MKELLDNLGKNENTYYNTHIYYDDAIELEEVIKLSDFLKTDNTVTHLHLLCEGLEITGVKALAEMITINKTLKDLCFIHSDIKDEGVVAIFKALEVNTSIVSVNVSTTGMGTAGLMAIVETLKTNTTLTSIHAGCNNIGDKAVVALSEVLETTNNTLRELNLEAIRISETGNKAILKMFEENTVITSFDAYSEHDEDTYDNEEYDRDRHLEYCESNKVIFAKTLDTLKKIIASTTELDISNVHCGHITEYYKNQIAYQNDLRSSTIKVRGNIEQVKAYSEDEICKLNAYTNTSGIKKWYHIAGICEVLSPDMHVIFATILPNNLPYSLLQLIKHAPDTCTPIFRTLNHVRPDHFECAMEQLEEIAIINPRGLCQKVILEPHYYYTTNFNIRINYIGDSAFMPEYNNNSPLIANNVCAYTIQGCAEFKELEHVNHHQETCTLIITLCSALIQATNYGLRLYYLNSTKTTDIIFESTTRTFTVSKSSTIYIDNVSSYKIMCNSNPDAYHLFLEVSSIDSFGNFTLLANFNCTRVTQKLEIDPMDPRCGTIHTPYSYAYRKAYDIRDEENAPSHWKALATLIIKLQIMHHVFEPSTIDDNGNNYLHHAILIDAPELVKLLLQNRVDPYLQSNYSLTPLDMLTSKNSNEVFAAILQNGIDLANQVSWSLYDYVRGLQIENTQLYLDSELGGNSVEEGLDN